MVVCIFESCGIISVIVTYLTILIANLSFINIVILPSMNESDDLDKWVLLAMYEFVILMIVWSHLKTMLTEPGYVPKGYLKYKKQRLPAKLQLVLDYIDIKNAIETNNNE